MKIPLKLFIIDVDGTLTDSGIYYDEKGNEIKRFSTRDAAGIFAAKQVGIKTMIVTGRESTATLRRMKELKIDFVYQNIKDKSSFIFSFLQSNGYTKNEVGYIGDDLNDYEAMQYASFVACPSDSCNEIKSIANYISPVKGGYGAVRDVIEYYLKKYGEWDFTVRHLYGGI